MRLETLEEFATLAKHLSFTETAHLLSMSQPTLSKHINSLERELRVPLFERSGPSLVLTPAGELVLPYVFTILENAAEMNQMARKAKNYLVIRLAVGGLLDVRTTQSIMTHVINTLGPKYGNDFLEIKTGIIRQPLDLDKDSSQFDLVFGYFDEMDETEDGTEIRLIAKTPLSAVVNRSHHLAGRDSLSMMDLRDCTLVKLEGSYIADSWRFIESACLSAGFTPKCQSAYFLQMAELIKVTSNINEDVLLLTHDTIYQYGSCISPRCSIVPIDDPFAFMPVSIAYSLNNTNPILDDVIETILDDAMGEQV